ncbi:pyridoxamine 5'-phosphate oxidase family protein [Planobispora longispora]|uniref:Pyridoxamine 5'-phosphate oxidase N-terminal domain-containing protein n=1 Tax=Planobispora longispora TaxID=28887 RepID=A0A8J3W6X7_9ACTN|nr:pyridoxamine 5'-phosphate oxidase family protein [Planobispora longispora]BFE84206.1 hypothetical protein GCM10020093_068070 [Planobispora longispora]GIH78994.1 hypothetical protein Plo01_54230 [Planobispora longispora]
MTLPPPRSGDERRRDTLARLVHDVDVWVASADDDGNPYLVPLSFLWDDGALIVSTSLATPTGRNLSSNGRVRIGLGVTRDVVMIDGAAETIPSDRMPQELADAFAEKTGFDPRKSGDDYLYFRIVPTGVQAWREVNELKGRNLMRDGNWLV